MGKQTNYPGVYVEETSFSSQSIAAVETAVPVFIGYTEKALDSSNSLLCEPTLVHSLAEFERLFGQRFSPTLTFQPHFHAVPSDERRTKVFRLGTEDYAMSFLPHHDFYLHQSVQLFFANGGRRCYVVSVNTYKVHKETGLKVSKKALLKGLETIATLQEPTLVVVPDLMQLGSRGYLAHERILAHCAEAPNRFAILDIYEGYFGNDPQLNFERHIADFRSQTATVNLAYGAAYYPWLETQTTPSEAINITNFESTIVLVKLLPEPEAQELLENFQNEGTVAFKNLHLGLQLVSPTYKELLKHIDDFVNEQPPSGAIAGLYALLDSAQGVWVAPANRSVLATKGPTRVVSHTQQEALNIDSASGKSINAIRSFPGKGTLVWGARTLDGNSSEWKYVPVRRLLSMLSASIESGLDWAVFEPNDANTWSRVERSVSNFLNDLWRQGAFAGAKASEAYYVKVGLNSTMTENDIDNNILRIEIGVAPLRPAEFIILQIQQFFKRE